MPDPLIEKLQQFESLSSEAIEVLATLSARTIAFRQRSDILREGAPFAGVYLLRRGWACRYTILPSGKRQIISFVIPGDLCNDHVMLFRRMEHSIGALTSCEVGVIPPEQFLDMLNLHPRIGTALYWSGLVTEAVLRERIVTLGRRSATQRIAHLFCELLVRLRAAGLAKASGYDLPLTQADIADTLGLNHVHVNRVVRTMCKIGLIRLKGHVLEIADWDNLTALGEFDPEYLDGLRDARTGTTQAPR